MACVTCLVYVLRERGEWPRARELGRELIDAGTAVWVAEGLLGAIHAFQGKLSSGAADARPRRWPPSRAVGHFHMWVDSTAGLAYVAAAEGAHDEAAEHCRALLDALGGQRGPPLRGLGAALGRGFLRAAAATAPARTPAPRR